MEEKRKRKRKQIAKKKEMQLDPEPSKRGIRNIGNTCFLNAVIHMLYSISTIHDIFQDISTSDLAKFKRPICVLNEEDIERRDSSDPKEREKFKESQAKILNLRRAYEEKDKQKAVIRERVLDCFKSALRELKHPSRTKAVNLESISPNILQSLYDLGLTNGTGEMNDASETLIGLLPLQFESNAPDEYLREFRISKVSFSYCYNDDPDDRKPKNRKLARPILSKEMRDIYHVRKKRKNGEIVSIIPEVAGAKKVGKGRTVQTLVDNDQKIGIVNDEEIASCRRGTYIKNLQYQVDERSKYVLVPIQRQVFRQTGGGRSAISENANTPTTASVRVTRLLLDMDDRGDRRREYTPVCAVLVTAGHYMFARIKETPDGGFDVTHVYNDAEVHVGDDASEFMESEMLSLEKNASVLLYRRVDESLGSEIEDEPTPYGKKRNATRGVIDSIELDSDSEDDSLHAKPAATRAPAEVVEITESDSDYYSEPDDSDPADPDYKDLQIALAKSKQEAFERWAHDRLGKRPLKKKYMERLGFVNFGQIIGLATAGRY